MNTIDLTKTANKAPALQRALLGQEKRAEGSGTLNTNPRSLAAYSASQDILGALKCSSTQGKVSYLRRALARYNAEVLLSANGALSLYLPGSDSEYLLTSPAEPA